MKILLDTHTVLWWVGKHDKLSPVARGILLNNANSLHVSVVSAWEIAIKTSLGKLPGFAGGAKAFLKQLHNIPAALLPLSPRYIEEVETLPFLHRDPFDRLLVATAKADGMTLLTADENIRKYDIFSTW